VAARSVRAQSRKLFIGMRCVACAHRWTEERDEPRILQWRRRSVGDLVRET
jgi:hypothetical protein